MTPTAQVDISPLYRRHVALVRGCALRSLGEPAAAKGVAQEVFIRFLQHGDRSGSEQDTAAFSNIVFALVPPVCQPFVIAS